MAILTLDPTATAQAAAPALITGGATQHAVLADNSDGTHVQTNGASSFTTTGILTLADPTIPAGGLIKQVRVAIRSSDGDVDFGTTRSAYIRLNGTNLYGVEAQVGVTNIHDAISAWYQTKPDGFAFTAADANGFQIEWDVQGGPSSAGGIVYKTYVQVEYNLPPTCAVTGPVEGSTVTTTNTPTVTWTYADTENDAQDKYHVKVFSAAQYGAGGFDPEVSVATWDSGLLSGSVLSSVVGVALANGTYRAYVKVRQAAVAGQVSQSAWDFNQFTVTVDAPGVPAFVLTPDQPNGRIAVAVVGTDNMLTKNQASLETDTTGWQVGTGAASIARDTGQFLHGVASLRVTSSATGNMNASTIGGVVAAPCVAGAQYTGFASVKAGQAVGAQTARVQLTWFDAAGATLSTSSGSSVAISNASWTQAVLTAVAPASAAFVRIIVQVQNVAAIGEFYFWDSIKIAPGTSTVWSGGDLAVTAKYTIEYSDDAGVTWAALRDGSAVASPSTATQAVTVYDYEAKLGVARQYRVYTTATIPGGTTVLSSAYAAVQSATVQVHASRLWWFKVPKNSSLNCAVKPTGKELVKKRPKDRGVFSPLGREFKVTVTDKVRGREFVLMLLVKGDAEWAAVEAVYESAEVVLLQTDVAGEQWYLDLQDLDEAVQNTGSRLAGNALRYVTIPVIETDAP